MHRADPFPQQVSPPCACDTDAWGFQDDGAHRRIAAHAGHLHPEDIGIVVLTNLGGVIQFGTSYQARAIFEDDGGLNVTT